MNGTTSPITPSQSKTSALAVTSLVFGILSIACLGPLFAIPAVICGHVAQSRIRKSAGALSGNGLAIGGFVTGYLGIALSILLLTIAVPNFIRAKHTAQKNFCINNLREIEGAKQNWALENNKQQTDAPSENDLKAFLHHDFPKCPAGGTYSINPISERPTCSVPEHRLD
jgi:competence protein ComGC